MPVKRAAAFAITGFVVAAHPMLAPAVALLRRPSWAWSRRDIPWGASVALFATLTVVHRSFDWNALGVALAWIVFRVAGEIGRNANERRWWIAGFALGGVALLGWSIVQITILGDSRASGPPWIGHPNLLAHVWLVVVAVPLATSRNRALRLGAAALVPLGLLLSGSRSGLLAGVVALALSAPRWLRTTRPMTAVALVAVMVTAVVALSPRDVVTRLFGFPLMVADVERSVNMLVASEDLANTAAWGHFGVEVSAVDGGEPPTPWTITRTSALAAARPQQFVTLVPERRYVFAAELARPFDGAPGLLAWGADENGASELRVAIGSDGVRAEGRGRVHDVVAGSEALDDGWTRVWVAFSARGPGPLGMAFGPSPDLGSARTLVDVRVRALQLEAGEWPTAYAATEAFSGALGAARGEAAARLTHWRIALEGIAARPFLGWGYDTFGAYAFADGRAIDRPRHPHNQVFSSAFEGGLVGLLALVCVIAGLLIAGRSATRVLVIALLIANVFDTTLLASFVLFPLALLAGLERDAASDQALAPLGAPKTA